MRVSKQMQPAQHVVERNENRLLRQHQTRQQQREYVPLARRVEPLSAKAGTRASPTASAEPDVA